jgi:pantothenate kinase
MPKTLKETLIGTLGGKFKFYILLDQSANIKVIEHQKPSSFHIEGFPCSMEKFGLICKRTQEPLSG